MIGLFDVMFFDPDERTPRVESVKVVAKNAEQAISKARAATHPRSTHWDIESVTLTGWSDE